MRDGVFAEDVCCRDVDMNCGKIPDDVTDLQAILLAAGIAFFLLATGWSYRKACADFEKIDL